MSQRSTVRALCAVAALSSLVHAQQFQYQVNMLSSGPARWTEGVECADVDNDGDLDIFFAEGDGFNSAGTKRQNVLMINQFVPSGTLSFTYEGVARLGTHVSNAKGVVTRDVNGDGWVDVLFCNAFATDTPFLYINQGAANPGFFNLESSTRGLTALLSSGNAQFGDVDDDGDPDLLLNDAYLGSASSKPKLYMNDGAGFFTLNTAGMVAAANKTAQMDVQLVDLDNDWDLDFFGPCRASNGGVNHYLMLNDGLATFTNAGFSVPSNSGSTYEADVGDLDGDTDIDLFMVSSSGFAEGAIRNNLLPGGPFGMTQLGTFGANDDNEIALFDYDVDGDYDVIVGSLSGGSEAFWRNDGGMTFSNQSGAAITALTDSTLDLAIADLDNDGKYDIVTGQGESGTFLNKAYKNTGAADTLAPVVVAIDAPASSPAAGPTKVRAKVRDQVMDDSVDYVRGQARYVVLTSTSTLNVSIDAGGFSPSVLNVSAGTQVVWTNNSGSNQSVKSTSAPFTYDSGTLANGQTYSHYFVNPGTYNYVSQPSGLVGQVLVSSGASFTITATYTGGGVRRFSMTDTAAGTGVQLVYELVFTDWAGNVRVTDGNAITLTGGGGCASASTYCTTKMNSLFCLPAIGSTGTASASAGSGFNISASNIINNKQGLLFYGVNGQSSAPYQGGTLCVKSPTIRTPVQNSGGSPTGSDCSGVFNFDFNVRIASGVDPLLVQGVVVDSQYWSRDPADPFHTNLTNGLHFTICP